MGFRARMRVCASTDTVFNERRIVYVILVGLFNWWALLRIPIERTSKVARSILPILVSIIVIRSASYLFAAPNQNTFDRLFQLLLAFS